MTWLPKIGRWRRVSVDVDSAGVTVYRRPDAYYVITEDRTTDGLWMLCSPAAMVNLGADADILGRVIFEAVMQPGRIVPHPRQDQWTEVRRANLEPLQQQAGVRSWRAFVRSARIVSVHRQNALISVTPYMREPGRKDDSFIPIAGRRRELDSPGSRALGEAVLEAFNPAPGDCARQR